MSSRSRPRLVDVANKLNVAPSTVSRALAGSESVSSSTRERVVAAARELGYTPNPVASGLKRGRTLNIGLIAVMNHWYAGAVTSGADRVAAECGYDFVVMNSAGGDDEELLFSRARRLGNRVDGVVIVDVSPDNGVLDRLVESVGVPAVTLGCSAEQVSSVLVDNHAIGALAANHLAALGHIDAVVLAFDPPTPSAINNGSVRAAAFQAAFDGSAGVTRVSRSGHEERRRMILDAVGDATAVFCTSDALAIETVALLRQGGVSVPEQVSVIGVDNHPLAAPIGLTTVAQTPEVMGAVAARMLVNLIAEPGTVSSTTMPIELVERLTTASPRHT